MADKTPYELSDEGYYTDIETVPPDDGLEDHQVWVWLGGANPPHWEIRGTGALFDD